MVEFLIGLIAFLLGSAATYILVMALMKPKAIDVDMVVIPHNHIFEETNDLILIFDGNHKLLDFNVAAKTFFRLTEDSKGLSIQAISDDLFRIVSNNTLAVGTLKNVVFDFSNKTHYYILEQRPLCKDTAGEDCYFISLRDNNEIHKTIEKSKELQKQAELSSGEKSMFLANMSHELRTPLNAIIGMSELMIETELNVDQKDLINSINQSANILYDIINSILDFSKLEANQMGLEAAPMDVIKILHEIETIFSHEAKVKNIALNVNIDKQIPPVLGDQVRLRQIIVNLVGNAIKFTHIGSVNLTANLVKKYQNSAEIEFIVSDTGIGFNEETKGRIFQPFVQEDVSITRKFGGTGLGLPICKSLVEMYGGELKIHSKVGEGSTFSFIISFQLTETDYSVRETKVSKKVIEGTPGKILVAEDNKTNQKLLKMQLEKYNYEVSIVDNGQEVVEEYFESEYDLIIMDCQMPVMDGFCATLIIRQQEELFNKHIPIIALTASALKEDKEKCIQTGMDDYITKPVKIETLHQTIQQWLTKIKK